MKIISLFVVIIALFAFLIYTQAMERIPPKIQQEKTIPNVTLNLKNSEFYSIADNIYSSDKSKDDLLKENLFIHDFLLNKIEAEQERWFDSWTDKDIVNIAKIFAGEMQAEGNVYMGKHGERFQFPSAEESGTGVYYLILDLAERFGEHFKADIEKIINQSFSNLKSDETDSSKEEFGQKIQSLSSTCKYYYETANFRFQYFKGCTGNDKKYNTPDADLLTNFEIALPDGSKEKRTPSIFSVPDPILKTAIHMEWVRKKFISLGFNVPNFKIPVRISPPFILAGRASKDDKDIVLKYVGEKFYTAYHEYFHFIQYEYGYRDKSFTLSKTDNLFAKAAAESMAAWMDNAIDGKYNYWGPYSETINNKVTKMYTYPIPKDMLYTEYYEPFYDYLTEYLTKMKTVPTVGYGYDVAFDLMKDYFNRGGWKLQTFLNFLVENNLSLLTLARKFHMHFLTSNYDSPPPELNLDDFHFIRQKGYYTRGNIWQSPTSTMLRLGTSNKSASPSSRGLPRSTSFEYISDSDWKLQPFGAYYLHYDLNKNFGSKPDNLIISFSVNPTCPLCLIDAWAFETTGIQDASKPFYYKTNQVIQSHNIKGFALNANENSADKKLMELKCVSSRKTNDIDIAVSNIIPDPSDKELKIKVEAIWLEDLDQDGIGDECDDDIDGDGVLNVKDNCPKFSNKGQEDADKNNIGDVCDEKYLATLKPDLIITDVKANQYGGAIFIKNIGKANVINKNYSVGIVRASRMRSVGQRDNVNYTGKFDFVLPVNKDILSGSTTNLSFPNGIIDPNDKEGFYLFIDLGDKLFEEREDNNFYFTCFNAKTDEKCDPYKAP
ncbi:MAG: thrombospondin type 3 repeat-containing protein [Pseudomonadota bacterium]